MESIEQYVNNETIIKDSIYESFKEFIICPICKKIIIEPVMCLICFSKFCKNCKDKGVNLCKCDNPKYQSIKEDKKMISKFKFKCIKGCGEEIPYDEIKNHYSTDCSKKEKKIKFLNKDEVAKLNKEIKYLKGKYIIYFIFNFNSYYSW